MSMTMTTIRKYLIAGLLVWVPLWVTLLVLKFLIDIFDTFLGLLPAHYTPDRLFGFHIPGIGLILSALVVFLTGVFVTNFLGHRLVARWESLVAKIPLVRSIYNAVKQVMHTLLSSSQDAFRKVLLIEYPRKGIWSIAFQTSSGFKPEGVDVDVDDDLVTAFVPTTPNPTSGFLLMVPRKDVIELKIPVDEALKMVISLGVILPGNGKPKDALNVPKQPEQG